MGIIKHIVDGEQDMSFYGNEREDYELIHDYIVINQNQSIHNNISNLRIVDGKLKMVGDFMDILE